jgi:hypothetical protein
MIEFRPITVAEFRRESPALLAEHYEELARNKEVIKLAPNWEGYEGLERVGRLYTLSVWDDGEMVGYSVFMFGTSLHYRETSYASNDVLFLKASHRAGITGVKLIRECERQLAKLGVKKIFWRVKYGTVMEKLLPRMGYEPEEHTLAKLLGE